MKTEELNDYLFAELINKRAFSYWVDAVEELEKQGLTRTEAEEKAPEIDTYIPMALKRLSELKMKVFAALEESNQASRK